jgi:hypothetical protein
VAFEAEVINVTRAAGGQAATVWSSSIVWTFRPVSGRMLHTMPQVHAMRDLAPVSWY